MNGICAFIKEDPESSLVLPQHEDTVGDWLAATQERVSPEPAHPNAHLGFQTPDYDAQTCAVP